jgi:hypothetical protein
MDRTNGTQGGPQHAPSELKSPPAAIESPAKRRLRTFELRVMNRSQLLQQANPSPDSALEQEQPPTDISEAIFKIEDSRPVLVMSKSGADRRAAVDGFISKVAQSGRKITRKDIWTVAGYKDRREFERFQRGDERTTRSAITSFNRVLNTKAEDFIRALEKKTGK